MPCLVALLVLSIMGIFSASHRRLAKEAFDCVFRRVTLRPCTTGFDVKIKSIVTGPLINRSPKLAKFVHKRFEVLAWIFMLLMTASLVWTLHGVYSYWAWGNCNGANSGGFCAFDPTGANGKVTETAEGSCVDSDLAAKSLSMKPLTLTHYPTKTLEGSNVADHEIVFIGCYNCDYTRKAWPMIKDLIGKIPSKLVFIHFPTKPETSYLMRYDYCLYQESPEHYWKFVETMFQNDKTVNASEGAVLEELTRMGLRTPGLIQCLDNSETLKAVKARYQEIQQTGIYGTPTVFVNGTPVVGPKPERVYLRLLRGSWL